MGTLADFDFDVDPAGAEPMDDPLAQELHGTGLTDGEQHKKELAGGVDETAPIPGGGFLLEADPKAVFTAIDKEVRSQERLAKNRDEEDKHYDSVRKGVGFSFLEKSEDRSVVKRCLPPGVTDTPQPVPNKIDDLCNKIVSQILVDPFLPNPKPDGDTDRNRGAADLTKKFLRHNGGPSGTNESEIMRWALTTNITRCAAYEYFWVDKTAGGWRPKQVKAHPQAMDPKNPLIGPDGQESTDPILRYVAEVTDMEHPVAKLTGQPMKRLVFTKDAAAATRQWLPKVMSKHLIRSQIRTVPRTANAQKADAIIVLMWETVREAKRRFAVLDSMSKSDLKELCSWRPKRWKDLVPDAQRPKGDDVEDGSDNSLLFWYGQFCRVGDEYQDGGEVHVNGAKGGTILKRDTLREDVELEDGTKMPVLLDMPIAEFIALQDTADRGDPQGRAPIAAFAGAGELFTHLYLAILEVIDKGLHPNVYIPSTSTVTREDINRRDGTPIDILTGEDKPIYEQAPVLPPFTDGILERVETGMNSAAQTNETGNGLDSRYSQSGVAKEVALRTARMMLAQYWQNTVNGIVSCWRIQTQLAQARLTVPQMVKLSGEDSAYKQRYFVGSDMVGVSDWSLAPGSGSMMAGPEKVQWLSSLQQNAWIDPEQAGELARASMSDDLGLPPNVHEEHINRCIVEWVDGPSKEWTAAYQANQQMQQQYAAQLQQAVQTLIARGFDPTVAQQQAQQQIPQPKLQPLPTPFEPRPNDQDQRVAMIRKSKLSRLMATVDYSKWPKEWRSCVDTAYAEADKYAKGTPPEGTPEFQYQEFLSNTTKKVVGLLSTAIAKGVDPHGAADETKAKDAAASAGEIAKADATKQTTAMKIEHETREKAKDRAFEADQNERDRLSDAEKHTQSIQKDVVMASMQPKTDPTAQGAPHAKPGAPHASGEPHQ